ncbi:hypothetical protein SprV_0401428500 [Sparganum proliferum]
MTVQSRRNVGSPAACYLPSVTSDCLLAPENADESSTTLVTTTAAESHSSADTVTRVHVTSAESEPLSNASSDPAAACTESGPGASTSTGSGSESSANRETSESSEEPAGTTNSALSLSMVHF